MLTSVSLVEGVQHKEACVFAAPSFQAISDSAASYGRSESHRLPFLRVDEWITKKELKLGSCTNQGRTQRDVDVRDKVRKQFCKL